MNSPVRGMSIKYKLWLEKDGKPVFGIGKLSLLKAIRKEGSISKASKMTHISFRRAWGHLDDAEKNFGIPLLEKHRGGNGGGSTSLTDEASELVSRFERLSDEVRDFAQQRFQELFVFPVHNDEQA
jgi:molybdate transport system regulatory protein